MALFAHNRRFACHDRKNCKEYFMNKASLISLVCTSGNDKEIINLFDLFSGFLQSVQPFCKSSVIFYYKGGELTRLRLYLQTMASMAICARRFYPPKGGGAVQTLFDTRQ